MGLSCRDGERPGRMGYSLTAFSLAPGEDKSPKTRCIGHVRPRVGETAGLHI